jgi:hypothetical protein
MNNKRSLLLLLLLSSGCLSSRGFRFHGEYEAKESGYRIQLISQGYVNSGDDLANSAFALVQICALPGFMGRPFRIEMTALPNEWISLECQELGLPPTDWKRPEQLFLALLSRAGYQGPVSEEVKGSVRVIASALSGPKGVILKSQIESLGVLRADIEYGYKVMKDQPPKKWINGSELDECNTGR